MTSTAFEEIRSHNFLCKLREIHELLAEAYRHYFATSDGHCKSSEGVVSVTIPEYFWSFNSRVRPRVEIYSYVLGPHRQHDFDDIDQALAAVREWHKAEMGEK